MKRTKDNELCRFRRGTKDMLSRHEAERWARDIDRYYRVKSFIEKLPKGVAAPPSSLEILERIKARWPKQAKHFT